MPKYGTLFSISAYDFLDELEKDLERLRERVAALEGKARKSDEVTRFSSDGDDLQNIEPPTRTHWSYHASTAARFSDNFYDRERSGQAWKRWVGPLPFILIPLHVRRDIDYLLTVELGEFANPQARDEFSLKVDGREAAWRQAGDRLFSAVIPASAEMQQQGRGLFLELGIPEPLLRRPAAGDNDRRVLAFSVIAIVVEPEAAALVQQPAVDQRG
jgi:hypothetical protein